MKGFLAGLAARSTGHERVLEPRRLLFEPRDDAALEPGVDPRPAPVAEPPRSEEPPVPARRQQAQPRAPEAEREKHEAPSDDAPPVARNVPAPRRRRPPLVGSRPVREPPGPTREDPHEVQPARHEVSAPLPTRRHTPGGRAEAPRPPATELRAPAPAERLRALRGPPAVTESSSARERIVRITIGRVDVRAVQAPEAKPQSARSPATKRMTLQEYLARGARR